MYDCEGEERKDKSSSAFLSEQIDIIEALRATLQIERKINCRNRTWSDNLDIAFPLDIVLQCRMSLKLSTWCVACSIFLLNSS